MHRVDDVVVALGVDHTAVVQRVGVGGELVLDLQGLDREHGLLALQRTVDEAGHEFLRALPDLLAVADGERRHATEVAAAQPSVQLQVLVLVQGQ